MIGIDGISPNGQALGIGYDNSRYISSGGWYPPVPNLYYRDIDKDDSVNISSLIDSTKWTTSAQATDGRSPYWHLSVYSMNQLDNDGRVLVQATQGDSGSPHTLLLVPDGVSVDPPPVPEPATWAVFATLIVGAMAHKRIRTRRRIPLSDPSRLM